MTDITNTPISIDAYEDEIERLDNVIKAAEDWSAEYSKAPNEHADLIKTESKMERRLRAYFRELADRCTSYISWPAYEVAVRKVKADDTEIIVTIDDTVAGREDMLVIQAMYDPTVAAIVLGIDSGEAIYQSSVGLSAVSTEVQVAARELVAQLVGRTLDGDGNIIDNPKAKYRISDITRRNIQESIRTSISLGENITDAKLRLQTAIKDPRRALTIARTETVNAFQKGMMMFAGSSGAVAKEWMSSNPKDVCGEYGARGVVALDHVYDASSKLLHPAAHPNCRCSLRLVYPEELNITSVDK